MALADRAIGVVLKEPRSWLALLVVVGLEAAFFHWFRPSLPMAGAALALGIACALAWPVIFVRSESFVRRFHAVPESVRAREEEKLQALAQDFDELDFGQGTAQIAMLRQKFENLSEIMKRRLNAGELTYGRYLGMAEQVYFSALDNLHEVAVSLRSISTIDPDYIQKRLRELGHDRPSEEQANESLALRERHGLYDEQRQRVTQLIAQNETAMTVLDKTATALAETRTAKGQASMDARTAIAELERLASRAGAYALDSH